MKDENAPRAGISSFILHPSSLPQLGVRGFEPRTSALSELRSNQLSYTPFPRIKAGHFGDLGANCPVTFRQDWTPCVRFCSLLNCQCRKSLSCGLFLQR